MASLSSSFHFDGSPVVTGNRSASSAWLNFGGDCLDAPLAIHLDSGEAGAELVRQVAGAVARLYPGLDVTCTVKRKVG